VIQIVYEEIPSVYATLPMLFVSITYISSVLMSVDFYTLILGGGDRGTSY
jgi:hypothetical protein